MNDAFQDELRAKLTAFREWSNGRRVRHCRLVQFCGVERIGAVDVPLEDTGSRIEGLVSEGFYVDWAEHNGRFYLRVWEYDGPEPPWPKVFAEEHIEDFGKMIGDVGL